MSTVLWAHKMIGASVECQEEDCFQLCKYSEALDAICEELDISAFSSLHDYTDMQFNLEEQELPDGMEDTSELMALKGNWVPADQALSLLSSLRDSLNLEGKVVNISESDKLEVLEELAIVISYAQTASEEQGKFNLSAVM